jgi:hypothetical protein
VSYQHVITTSEYLLASDLAHQTLEVFADFRGHYNNNLNSHLRGKLGEIAASAFLMHLGITVTNLWEDLNSLSDTDIIAPNRFRADVKTWDIRYWPAFGRCVSVDQFPKLRRKSDVVIWCIAESVLRPGMSVTVHGWSSMNDVENAPRRLTGPSSGRQVHNFQLDEAEIREVESLADFYAT